MTVDSEEAHRHQVHANVEPSVHLLDETEPWCRVLASTSGGPVVQGLMCFWP